MKKNEIKNTLKKLSPKTKIDAIMEKDVVKNTLEKLSPMPKIEAIMKNDVVKNTLQKLSPKDKVNDLIEKYSDLIREKAIAQIKAKLAERGKEVEDFTEEQRETMVAEEIKKVRNQIIKSTYMGALALLGLSKI